MINWKWNLTLDTERAVRYWAALLVIILHEISHMTRRWEIPTAYNIMSSTTPQKLLNGKHVKEAGNQLEFLLFGDVLKSIGDLDGIYLLKQTSWNASSIEELQKQLKDQIHQDISEQPENNQSYRLQLPGKCGEYDLPGNEERENSDRITIGICATGVYQPDSDLSDEPCEPTDSLMMIETTDPVLLPKSVVTNGYVINKNLLNSGINLFNHQSLTANQLKDTALKEDTHE